VSQRRREFSDSPFAIEIPDGAPSIRASTGNERSS